MELQSVFNSNVGKNKQPDLHGNHSMVNINLWNIKFSHFIIWSFMLCWQHHHYDIFFFYLYRKWLYVIYVETVATAVINVLTRYVTTVINVASDCTGPRRSRYIDCHRYQMLGHTSYISLKNKLNCDSIKF